MPDDFLKCPCRRNAKHFSALPLQAERLTIVRSVPAGFLSESCLKCIAAVWDRFYFTFSSFGKLLYAFLIFLSSFLLLFGSFFQSEFRPSPDSLPITREPSKGLNPGPLFDQFRSHLGLQNRSGGQRESMCDRLGM